MPIYFVVPLLWSNFAWHKHKSSMTLHIFNPEHDIALAHDNKYFTAPHAGRQLRHDLDYLPALWAKEDDYVLVENVNAAKVHARRFQRFCNKVHFLCQTDLPKCFDNIDNIEPWGWDRTLKFQLDQLGIDKGLMPQESVLDDIRRLSHRQFSASLLKELRKDIPHHQLLLGEAFYAESLDEVEALVHKNQKSIIKAPWSSSGRGLRYVEGKLDAPISHWTHNTIKRQGGVMVEPYYNKVKDFGMEFYTENKTINYMGLSVFHTQNGAYLGNSLEDEQTKAELLSTYIKTEILDEIKNTLIRLLNQKVAPFYTGPLGVDMMIISNDTNVGGFCIHPLVEINLRRTMGHVALSLSQQGIFQDRVMRIDYDGSHYHLHIISKE